MLHLHRAPAPSQVRAHINFLTGPTLNATSQGNYIYPILDNYERRDGNGLLNIHKSCLNIHVNTSYELVKFCLLFHKQTCFSFRSTVIQGPSS